MIRENNRQSGFTLLEVIMALTITGFVLGSLFSLVGGSKKLSWRSEESLISAAHLRAASNFALLENEYHDVELILQDNSYEIRALDVLEEPLRKTQVSRINLQGFEIINTQTDEFVTGSRWIQLELAQ